MKKGIHAPSKPPKNPVRPSERLQGEYTKGEIDALIDKRDAMKVRADELSEMSRAAWREYNDIVEKLQEKCPHDEGCEELLIPREDSYGRYLGSLTKHKCRLCDKIVKSETTGTRC